MRVPPGERRRHRMSRPVMLMERARGVPGCQDDKFRLGFCVGWAGGGSHG